MRKILCHFHPEKTPSLHLYEDHYHCYSCGAHGALEDLPETPESNKYSKTFGPRFSKENIKLSMDRIATLPRKVIRGLTLPFDDKGYYVVYPDTAYYVRRAWDANDRVKYHNPAGHPKQLLKLPTGDTTLVVVEGQLNALSAEGLANIVSPGAATDLLSPKLAAYCLQYPRIVVIVDKDPAGVVMGLKLKEKLILAGKRCTLYPMPTDLNDILVQHGKEAVKKEIEEALMRL